jgi:small-conductance mechanosensitive channel
VETVGVNLSSLAVIAGALGVGIGFGLQNIVSNFVSGLIILAERPIQIGDRVDLGNNTVGKVERIGARATHVLTNDNILIIVPNSEFVSGRVINWTHVDPRVRFRIEMGVGYGSDPHVVEKLLLEVADGNPNVLKSPSPTVVFKAFGESALNFELRVWSSGRLTRKPVELCHLGKVQAVRHRVAIPPTRSSHQGTPPGRSQVGVDDKRYLAGHAGVWRKQPSKKERSRR